MPRLFTKKADVERAAEYLERDGYFPEAKLLKRVWEELQKEKKCNRQLMKALPDSYNNRGR